MPAPPDVAMDDVEVMNLSSSSDSDHHDVTDSDDEDWLEEEEDGDDTEQELRELVKDLRNQLRVSLQKNKRRGEVIKKMKEGSATKPQMRKFLLGFYSQAYTNWLMTNRGTLLRKKRSRVAKRWSHRGISQIKRSCY